MSTPDSFTKDPDEKLDYDFDWTAWLGGDTIASFSILPVTGLTVQSSTATASKVTVWLLGGTLNTTVEVTCRITTVGGRIKDDTVPFRIRKR